MKLRIIVVFALLVGLVALQIVADVVAWPAVKELAAAMQVSPAMKVFTAHQGYETHAAPFHLSWTHSNGAAQQLVLDPRSHASVEGPYNRRNVYGAAPAYGPILRADPKLRVMQTSVMDYASCRPGTLRHEIGIPADVGALTVHVTPVRTDGRQDLELGWEVRCHE